MVQKTENVWRRKTLLKAYLEVDDDYNYFSTLNQ
jgi:hypothetical protein